MQDLRLDTHIDRIMGCAGTRVVRHHAPTLWGLVIHIGGNHKRLLLALGRHDLDALHQVMNRTGQRVNFMDSFRVGLHAAVGKHVFKCGAYGALPDQPRTTRVNANDVVLFSPTRHQLFDVRVVQGFVEVVFNVIRASAHNGCLEFGSFHDAFKSTRPPCELGNKKPGHMAVPGFRGFSGARTPFEP